MKMEDDSGPMAPPFELKEIDANLDRLLKGLTTEQAKANQEKYGLNEIPEEKEPLWKMFLK